MPGSSEAITAVPRRDRLCTSVETQGVSNGEVCTMCDSGLGGSGLLWLGLQKFQSGALSTVLTLCCGLLRACLCFKTCPHGYRCLIISPTEEIGILVMVLNKWGQVCPVDSPHLARGAGIGRVAVSCWAGILRKSHRLLGWTKLCLRVVCLGQKEILIDPSTSIGTSGFPFWADTHSPRQGHFIPFVNWSQETLRLGAEHLLWIPRFPPSSRSSSFFFIS